MDDPPIDECFRLLKLRRGVDFAAVKQAYRKNLYKCHPDRFQGKPDLLPVAERKTKRLVQVYGILEQWYQANGGTDIASFPRNTGPQPSPYSAEDVPPEDEEFRAFYRRLTFWLTVAAIALPFAAFAWWFNLGRQPMDASALVYGDRPVAPAAAENEAAPHKADVQAPTDANAASLTAMAAERDREKAAWVQAYNLGAEAEQRAAEKEMADAQTQYGRDVRDKAPQILDAENETARQADQAAKDSALARQAFARQEEETAEKLKRDYDSWLLARGREAVTTVKELRERENAEIGVFSDTEDPTRIFEFWTAEEAGGPEINIAAKTGVAVSQPDARFFPHFRSNIFLYNPEGQTLVHMMESIAARHASLTAELSERKSTDESALANWEVTHPAGPARLSSAVESVMKARDAAIGRLSQAKARLADAAQALDPSRANRAFDQSPKGKEWAERIRAMKKALNLAAANP